MLGFFPFHFREGKVLELTALASLPSTPVGASLCLQQQPRGQLHQSHTCHGVCSPLCCRRGRRQAPCATRIPCCRHYTALRSLSTAWSHSWQAARWIKGLSKLLSGCFEKSECDTASRFLALRRGAPRVCPARRTRKRAAVPSHVLFAFTRGLLKEQEVKMHHHRLIFVAG